MISAKAKHSKISNGTGLITAALAAAMTLLVMVPAAEAKRVVDYFGTEPGVGTGPLAGSGEAGGEFTFPGPVAVNTSGEGAGEQGDIYVLEHSLGNLGGNHRVQRFSRDTKGTPTPYDDTYHFVSAWGADVVSAGGAGDLGDATDANYEICTVASECKAGVASGGNSTAAGNGTFDFGDSSAEGPPGIAVDQDTGNVFVSDLGNHRVNVYEGDGTFLRSFGWGVTADGPGNLPGADEVQTLTIDADGGKFSLEFRGETTGARTSDSGGSIRPDSPTSLNERNGASFMVDPPVSGSWQVGDGISIFSGSSQYVPPGTTVTGFSTNPVNGLPIIEFSQPHSATGTGAFVSAYGHDLDFGATAQEVEDAINGLPTIGGSGGSVTVSGPSGGPYEISFEGDLTGQDLPQIIARGENLTLGGGTGSAEMAETTKGGVYEQCVATDDVCQSGSPGDGAGQIHVGAGLAVSPPDGDPGSGTVFLADSGTFVGNVLSGNRRVNTYDLDGSNPSSFGSEVNFSNRDPSTVAVDSRGIVYASDIANDQQILRYDSEGIHGPVGFLAPLAAPPLDPSSSAASSNTTGLAVDPANDALYVLRTAATPAIQQFGPVNDPGLPTPASSADAEHTVGQMRSGGSVGLAFDESGERLYFGARGVDGPGAQSAHGIYVVDEAGPSPTAALNACDEVTSTSTTCHATIDPNGPPLLSYHLEYSSDEGSTWQETPPTVLGIQDDPQDVDIPLEPAFGGLVPNTTYQVRLAAAKKFAASVLTAPVTITTDPEAPHLETTGAAVPSATSAILGGRVNPRNSATEFHFEYGSEGPCSANPCDETSPVAAGSGNEIRFASTRLTGLAPDTTYHYRLVGGNGAPGSPAFGEDMSLKTHSDEPLTNERFPHPPGNDRAYEQVSLDDTGGNPVALPLDFAANGDRALYQISGGTPISESGSFFNQIVAERVETSPHQGDWEAKLLVSRSLYGLNAPDWFFTASAQLTGFVGVNTNGIDASLADVFGIRHFSESGSSQLLAEFDSADASSWYAASSDLSAVVTGVRGDLDPANPTHPGRFHLYEVSGSGPELIDILPDGSAASCGVAFSGNTGHRYQLPSSPVGATPRGWVSDEGRYVFFPSRGDSADCSSDPVRIYIRDRVAGETKLISGDTPEDAGFLRSIGGSAFFHTKGRLTEDDRDEGGDVYRYEIGSEGLGCISCAGVGGVPAEIPDGPGDGLLDSIGLSRDGSAVYFRSPNRMMPEALSGDGIYRVEVSSGELSYVAPYSTSSQVSVGDAQGSDSAVSHDGSVLVFASGDPRLNPLGGAYDNAGTRQYYRYDHSDRSLVCVSCPPDGSAPFAEVNGTSTYVSLTAVGTRGSVLSHDGDVLVFDSPSALVNADQNTPGTRQNPYSGQDVYEWRDGRALLVSDGLTNWPARDATDTSVGRIDTPDQYAVSPSGRDIFFSAPAQYTADAIDGYRRLYTARLGGGFVFPEEPPPCPLEACQGTPAGAPEDPRPSSLDLRGLGNLAAEPGNCLATARRARRLGLLARRYAMRAKRMRRVSVRSSSPRRVRILQRRGRRIAMAAKRRAVAAKRLRASAKRCRQNNRRAAR